VFETLREAGRVEDAEMFKTFNMGIGYVVIVPAEAAETAARILRSAGEHVTRIGEIVPGERGVELTA
jgi:phosphoribosylformylglycinamidine cyclo-ligase